MVCRTNGVSDQWCVAPMVCRTNGVSDQWCVGPMTCNPFLKMSLCVQIMNVHTMTSLKRYITKLSNIVERSWRNAKFELGDYRKMAFEIQTNRLISFF